MQLPFQDNRFDCAVDVVCIAHNSFQDAELIVAEVARVLKPGGKLFSVMPADTCWRGPFDEKGTVIFLDMYAVRVLFEPHFDVVINWTQTYDAGHILKHWLVSATLNKLGE